MAQRSFVPGDKGIDWAIRIVVADKIANEQGKGAWTLDEIDVPVVAKAIAILAKAKLCDYNLHPFMEAWKNQVPE